MNFSAGGVHTGFSRVAAAKGRAVAVRLTPCDPDPQGWVLESATVVGCPAEGLRLHRVWRVRGNPSGSTVEFSIALSEVPK